MLTLINLLHFYKCPKVLLVELWKNTKILKVLIFDRVVDAKEVLCWTPAQDLHLIMRQINDTLYQ